MTLESTSTLLVLLLLEYCTTQLIANHSAKAFLETTRSEELSKIAQPRVDDRACNSTDVSRSKKRCHINFHAENSIESEIDRILTVEVEPTQFVITTTKQGPVESLRINIELIDLHENRTLPRIDLYGLFLLVVRGRYTVPFLKPERWYGLTFSSQNVFNKETIMHKENRLLRTANQQRDIVQAKDMYEILVHHDVDGEQNPETTYITSRWSGEERVPSGELHISVIISCETSSTSEQMILNSVEDSITIEISMDLHYDITHLSDSGNRVLARITPLECHKICWQSSLVAQVDTMCFISDMSSECHIIDPITYITSLREMKRYTVKQRLSGFELIVETELSGDTEKAFIVLSIFNLAKNSSETLSKKFSTDSSNGTFSVPLSSDTVYAVEYKYIKVKPFHFSTKKHFLIEVSLGNNSEPSYPLVEVEFHMGNDTRTESGFIPSSHVTFTRSELYSDREIHLHLEPFCSEMQNTTWIFSDQKTSHHVDVTPAICSQTNEPKFCQYENYTKCSSYLCYSTSVVINDNEYSGDVRCFDFTQQLPINSNSNRLPTFTYLLTALFLVISIHVE